MSLILSSTSIAAEAAAKAPRTSVMTDSESKGEVLSLMKSLAVSATGLFSGAIIHGGHFNVTIKTVTSHQLQSQQQEKAINSFSRF